MRLSEIDPAKLTPGSKTSMSNISLDNLFDYIKTHCSQSLKIMNDTGSFLFRGSYSLRDSVIVGQSRDDRRPKDTSRELSDIFDAALESQGFKALRRNSIFVTSNYEQAREYGDVYFVFPMDGFHYTYTNRDDLIIKSQDVIYYPPGTPDEVRTWYENNKNDATFSAYKLKELRFNTIAIPNDRTSGVTNAEMASYQYRLVSKMSDLYWQKTSDPILEKYYKLEQSVSYKGVFENLEPMDTNIEKAISLGHEIMINGKYVALSKNHSAAFIGRLIGPI